MFAVTRRSFDIAFKLKPIAVVEGRSKQAAAFISPLSLFKNQENRASS